MPPHFIAATAHWALLEVHMLCFLVSACNLAGARRGEGEEWGGGAMTDNQTTMTPGQ